jgi:radical SAM protein with 4Fe4S-binding SPASM domain
MLVFYEVTQACDLVCQHCRACAQSQRHPFELGTDESKRLIGQLAEFPEPPMLVLTGGDPLKRSDIFELIEHAVECGLQVSITPSATPLVTRGAIQRLRDAGIARMAISIDGADAETHDANRGVSGSFARSLEILNEARSLNVQTQINTTLTPKNVDQIETMADRFADLGITLWSVFFLVPVGRAGAMERLDGEACERAFERLWAQSRCQPYLIKTTEAPHYRRYSLQQQGPFLAAGVNDGKGVMFVSHTGTIHPSGFLPIICGMYPQQHVVSVYQNSPLFRRLRDANQLQGKCGECEFRQVCGGSRARAYAVTGNLMSQEPDCLYVPQRMSREIGSPS